MSCSRFTIYRVCSARNHGALESGGGLDAEALEQSEDADADLVADRAHGFHALTCGVLEGPVLVALAGEDRAGVTAAHGDHDVGDAHGIRREDLGHLGAHVDALLE